MLKIAKKYPVPEPSPDGSANEPDGDALGKNKAGPGEDEILGKADKGGAAVPAATRPKPAADHLDGDEALSQLGLWDARPEKDYWKGARSIGLGLSVLTLGLSLAIHGTVFYLILFGLPAWMRTLPACLSGCLSCSGPCVDNGGFLSRLGSLPQCLSLCLNYSQAQRQAIELRPEQVITVEVFEAVPAPPSAPAQPPEADWYQLKGNSSTANEENPISDSADPASEEVDLAALAPDKAGASAPPEPDSEALKLGKKSPPPEIIPPELKGDETEQRRPAERRTKTGPLPLHEIITRSLGRDAANRMLGSAGGTEDDPAMRSYLTNVRVRLDRNWRSSISNRRGFQASYEMVIEPNGSISGFRLMRSTGDADFNKSVEAAIRKTSPLPPLPASYGRRTLRVGFTFSDRRS